MSGDNLGEEVDRFVGGLSGPDEPAKPRRRKAVKALPPPEEEPEPVREEEEEEEEEEEDDDDADSSASGFLPSDLPRPAESHRSLGSLMGKYKIGEDPNFRIQLHRLLPKFFPGSGIQAHGYIEEYVTPITEDYIAAEYGGGTYQVIVFGPDPKGSANSSRRYDSFKVEVGGAPNPGRLARSVQAKLDANAGSGVVAPVPSGPMIVQENPTLASHAMKMAEDAAKREREDRQRAEENSVKAQLAQRAALDPLIEAERRRADELVKAAESRADMMQRGLEERLKEAREETRRLEQKMETAMNAPTRSFAEEFEKIVPMIKGDGSAEAAAHRASETMTKNLLDNHKTEMESLHKQQQVLVESIRSSHASEIASMRDAYARELAAERESGRLREQRHEETLKVEREERRRDNELAKKTADERDKQWRDRMENQEIQLKTMWESRVETQKTNFESQLQWLRSECEQLKERVRSFETQVADRGDVVQQFSKMRDLRTVAKEALGIDDAPTAPSGGSGGIGLSGSDQPNWQEVITTAIESMPAIMQQLQGGGQPQPQPPQQQQMMQAPQQVTYQLGQIVETQQGTMVVVQAPNGALAFARKDEFDAHQAQQRSTSRQLAPGARPRGIFGQPPAKPSSGIPVPDMSVGLPLKPRPWGEPVQPEIAPVQQPQQQMAPQAPQQQAPRGRTPKPSAQPQQQGNMDQTQTQKLIANEVAKLVHKSVEDGDEPEEFVQKVLSAGYPEMVVKTIAAMSDDEVLQGIKMVQPNSAGTTPMGQRFVHQALAALRAAI